MPPAKLWVRIKGKKVKKKVKGYFFTSSPIPNSDNLILMFDGINKQVDLEFYKDNPENNEK